MTDWIAFADELSGIDVLDAPNEVQRRSRDFYWYSPVLKERLEGLTAERAVVVRSEDDVLRTARACVRQKIPLTVRGGGTGNYGQAVPMSGGVVLDVTGLDHIDAPSGGAAWMGAGIRMKDADAALIPEGWELRMHPSTHSSATVGGFVAGGSVGAGGITYGRLRDRGNILGARVVTMEDEPRVIELAGDDVQKVHQAWGINGIITSVRMPLAPAYEWIEGAVAFDEFEAAARFCQATGEADGLVKKLVTLLAWPVPSYFRRMRDRLPEGKHIALVMIAAPWWDLFEGLVAEHGGKVVLQGRYGTEDIDGPPLYEYAWNHTTLHAMKVDRSITYIQSLFPLGRNVELMCEMRELFGDEVLIHAEFQRINGQVTSSALQLVKYTTEARLNEIMDIHVANGIGIANPHTHFLDDGYKRVSLAAQLGLKAETDPYGLLNPGKIENAEAARNVA